MADHHSGFAELFPKAVLVLGITCWDTWSGLRAAHWVTLLYTILHLSFGFSKDLCLGPGECFWPPAYQWHDEIVPHVWRVLAHCVLNTTVAELGAISKYLQLNSLFSCLFLRQGTVQHFLSIVFSKGCCWILYGINALHSSAKGNCRVPAFPDIFSALQKPQ